MNNHDLGQRPREILEQNIPPLNLVITLTDRIEQSINIVRDL